MRKNFLLLVITFVMILPVLVFATGSNEGSSNESEKINNKESGEIEEVKAEIVTRPEDLHPDGVNMEVGTASYWLEVEAKVSGDVDATISYQWYESKDGTIENITPIEGETKSVFIPEQKLGTTYYCVGVTTTYNGKSTTEYTKLLEATFTTKVIDIIWITDVVKPVSGERMEEKASPYVAEYDLNSHYGYDIEQVSWTPDDKFFEDGKEYTINISIKMWNDVELADDLDVRVNNQEAKFEKTGQDTAVISYTFDKVGTESDITNSGEKTNIEYKETVEKDSLSMSAIILTTICIIVIIFAIIVITKRQ